MNDVATLAHEAIRSTQSQPEARGESPLIRKLFVLLHGNYGNLFVSKFSTGEKDANGKDKGIRAAMIVWESTLRKYANDVVEIAAARLQKEHPEFPPNLPQFEKLCDAATPRMTYAQEQGLVCLPAPEPAAPMRVDFSAQGDSKDWARAIVARHEAGDKIRPLTLKMARSALGMK